MQDFLFYILSFITLICGLMVVANPFTRNPVTSAMFLVLTIVSMAGLFILLNAFFLAAVQILVYAGAVIVLFLFVIMLLGTDQDPSWNLKRFGNVFAALAAGLVLYVLTRVIGASNLGARLDAPRAEGGTMELGRILFTDYLLPFEIMSLLLLVAMVGVILLSKKELK